MQLAILSINGIKINFREEKNGKQLWIVKYNEETSECTDIREAITAAKKIYIQNRIKSSEEKEPEPDFIERAKFVHIARNRYEKFKGSIVTARGLEIKKEDGSYEVYDYKAVDRLYNLSKAEQICNKNNITLKEIVDKISKEQIRDSFEPDISGKLEDCGDDDLIPLIVQKFKDVDGLEENAAYEQIIMYMDTEYMQTLYEKLEKNLEQGGDAR